MRKALLLAGVVAAGSLLHARVLWVDHEETDEYIYHALVEQLEAGHGYTLQGHPLLASGAISAFNYDHPLFLHPPGGPLLFLAAHRLFGEPGFGVVQLFSFWLFLFGVWLLGRHLTLSFGAQLILWTLAAFNPLLGLVLLHHWLDGPVAAFGTLAAGVFLWGYPKGARGALAAGVALGAASWIKFTALLVGPGACALAFAVYRPGPWPWLRRCALFGATAVLLHLPWLYWQYRVLGTAFPTWVGRPDAALVAASPFVSFVTVGRSPWIYVTVTARVLWTLAPSCAVLAVLAWRRTAPPAAIALFVWIAVILGFHVLLGAQGLAKQLRYVVLIAPAAVCLASVLWHRLGSVPRTHAVAVGRGLLMAGVVLELLQGLYTGLAPPTLALILPLVGSP